MQLVPRAYQLAIYNSIMQNGNTLVVLPTGLGKTLIALMLIQDKMKEGRCLFLTPTKPLAKQHFLSVMKTLELSEKNVALVSGEVAPAKRKAMYETDIIISTPQTIRNDLENSVLLPNFSLVIFDECHRAVGDYAYTYVSEKLHEHSNGKTLFVGLTASPGGRHDRIKEVMGALRIENVEIRDHTDPDVSPYVQKSVVSWIPVELSDHFKDIRKELVTLTSKYAERLAGMGFPPPLKHKGKFMALRQRILDIPHNIKYPALIQYSILLHLLHMTELLETQGVYPLRGYLEKLGEKESKSAKILLQEPGLNKVKRLCEKDEDHPKMKVLIDVLKKLSGKKIIVFVQYRAQISRIETVIRENGISAKQFVGKKDGVTKKMQEETIANFREGKFDVMVASSIGEEGLDIPAVDVVIFYEPVPSEIRSIQRRGRAARLKEGQVIVLMTQGTRDEYYYYASNNREKKMKKILTGMQKAKGNLGFKPANSDSRKESNVGGDIVVKPVEAKKKTKNQQTKMSDFIS
ncbi:ATP-dependent DNA helicase Hel308 [Candidatus Bilamarchaeum dharawalense]|uniref:ATP-dependent DNA helicase Hel308 n=1 Tax=Candidatus Bilamarchaeum dharawalense TaxID=2885759 RepID=A0A5E4LU81_9ARCH|nr:ATP-dependent DNA helicase Hel308 [Candidatus Bilamarchaeum dharawalense]